MARGGEGEIQQCKEPEALCERFAASLAQRATPSIHGRPGGWHVAADTWRHSARIVLSEIGLERALRAIDCVAGDPYLARNVRSLPALAERLDEVLLHLSAVEARASVGVGRSNGPDAPTWAEAQQNIAAAIRRHGTKRAAAAAELAALHRAYEPFIALVGWTNLCRDDPQRHQWEWQQAWKQACRDSAATETTEEAA